MSSRLDLRAQYYTDEQAPIDVDALVLQLAERFKEHGMNAHLSLLRGYYRAHKRRQRDRKAGKAWEEDTVFMWTGIWRIPPFDTVYPILRRGTSCRCGAQWKHGGGIEVIAECPEGRVLRCRECKLDWLVLDHGGA